jgi:hypothetical protein
MTTLNIDPIYSAYPHFGFGVAVTAANTAMDGTGTVTVIFTAGTSAVAAGAPDQGSFVPRVFLRPLGTNAASLVRIFVNNGATNTTASNNVLVGELTLPATTASNTIQQADFCIPIGPNGVVLDPGFRLLMTLGTAVAAGWIAYVPAGDY